MKKCSLIILLLLVLSLPCHGESRIVTIDLGSFSGFFGFGYEWIAGLSGHKFGMGIVDYQSIRIGYAYKKYFPDREGGEEQERPSRIFLGPFTTATFEDIYSDSSIIRYRLGLQMGYDYTWGGANQYYLNVAGGFLAIFPPFSYHYYIFNQNNDEPRPLPMEYTYRETFNPAFTVSFGYKY